MRHKIPDDKKKIKTAVSIDNRLLLIDNDIANKSKYIENLIRKDMEERGNNIKREF